MPGNDKKLRLVEIERREVPEHLTKLANFLDTSIRLPGGYRIGWDAVIGLIPGVGDVAGLALSLYIIGAAAKMGVGNASLLRMALNVAIETAIGSIPLVGDLFDMGFKANMRNLALIEAWCERPNSVRRQSGLIVLLTTALIAVLLAFALWVIVFVVMALVSLFG